MAVHCNMCCRVGYDYIPLETLVIFPKIDVQIYHYAVEMFFSETHITRVLEI